MQERKAHLLVGFFPIVYAPVIFCALLSALPSWAITTSGEITGDETWSGTVHMTGDVIVAASGSLTILPGTRVECEALSDDQLDGFDVSRIELIVQGGSLIADGTKDSTVAFTSSTSQLWDWHGIRILWGEATIRHCVVEYAYRGLDLDSGASVVENCTFGNNNTGMYISSSAALTLSNCTVVGNGQAMNSSADSSSLTLTDCLIAENSRGIMMGAATIDRCTVVENGEYGVYISGQVSTAIRNSDISDNGHYGVRSLGGSTLHLTDCTIQRNHDGVHLQNVMSSIIDCVITHNLGCGLELNRAEFVQHGITGNLIFGNNIGIELRSVRVQLEEGINQNDIYGNLTYEASHRGGEAVFVDDNYWGEPTTSELRNAERNLTKIFDVHDSSELGSLFIRTWREEAITGPTPTPTQTPLPTPTPTPLPPTATPHPVEDVLSIASDGVTLEAIASTVLAVGDPKPNYDDTYLGGSTFASDVHGGLWYTHRQSGITVLLADGTIQDVIHIVNLTNETHVIESRLGGLQYRENESTDVLNFAVLQEVQERTEPARSWHVLTHYQVTGDFASLDGAVVEEFQRH